MEDEALPIVTLCPSKVIDVAEGEVAARAEPLSISCPLAGGRALGGMGPRTSAQLKGNASFGASPTMTSARVALPGASSAAEGTSAVASTGPPSAAATTTMMTAGPPGAATATGGPPGTAMAAAKGRHELGPWVLLHMTASSVAPLARGIFEVVEVTNALLRGCFFELFSQANFATLDDFSIMLVKSELSLSGPNEAQRSAVTFFGKGSAAAPQKNDLNALLRQALVGASLANYARLVQALPARDPFSMTSTTALAMPPESAPAPSTVTLSPFAPPTGDAAAPPAQMPQPADPTPPAEPALTAPLPAARSPEPVPAEAPPMTAGPPSAATATVGPPEAVTMTAGPPGAVVELLKAVASPQRFAELGGKPCLSAPPADAERRPELWVADGAPDGAELVKGIRPRLIGSSPCGLTAPNGKLRFRTFAAETWAEHWVANGAEAGTALLKGIDPGSGHSCPSDFAEFDGRLLFRADNGANGHELWAADGAEVGAEPLKGANPGPDDSSPHGLTALNGKLCFQALAAENGHELWVTDGAKAGAELLKDADPGPGDSCPSDFAELDSRLLF